MIDHHLIHDVYWADSVFIHLLVYRSSVAINQDIGVFFIKP